MLFLIDVWLMDGVTTDARGLRTVQEITEDPPAALPLARLLD
jgi:hypothetical protein